MVNSLIIYSILESALDSMFSHIERQLVVVELPKFYVGMHITELGREGWIYGDIIVNRIEDDHIYFSIRKLGSVFREPRYIDRYSTEERYSRFDEIDYIIP